MESHEAYALSFTLLSVLLAFAASWIIYANRNESRMKVRFPMVLWLELFVSAIHSADVALWYVGYFAADKCQPAASIIEGTEWLIASFFIGRMCLVYMQAKANNLLKGVSKISDGIVHVLAFLTAPGYYYRLKEAHEVIEKSMMKNPEGPNDVQLQNLNRMFTGELRYLFCACCWGCYGFISSYLYTTLIPTDPEAVASSSTTECWLIYIRFQTAILFLVVGFIAGFFVFIFHQVRDLVGTRNEFVIAFSIVTIVKIFNGLNIAILFFVESFWGDLLSVFLYPFIVTLITTIYVYRWDAYIESFFSRRSRRTKSEFSSEAIKTWKDVQTLWNSSPEGKELIVKVANQLYMGETVKFLEATDTFTEETLQEPAFRNIFNVYVKTEARNQINISHRLRTQWEKVIKLDGCDWNLLVATRTEMFVLIWPGFVRHTTIMAQSTELLSPDKKSRSRRSSDRDKTDASRKKPSLKRTHSGHADSESGKSSTQDPTLPSSGAGPRKLADVVADHL